ncbi:MAG: NAD(P)-dependent oxidoreductase [Chloroflexi bacterium]|nr:NAD(P)-dependent oxidoreductase [Chloroflexota bacterium]
MRVAFIGLGTMGSRMVANLQEHGHDLIVNDVRREAAGPALEQGAVWADSPRAAARDAELVLSSLPGPREVAAVVLGDDGILSGIGTDAVYADLSTSSVSLARQIYADFKARGICALDAPVSGGPMGAQDGSLIVMVGGDESAFQRALPAFKAIGSNIQYCGQAGNGAVAKLCHNMIGLASSHVLAEGFTLAVKAGLDPAKFLDVLLGGAYGRQMGLRHGIPEVIFKGDFDTPRFAFALARKDIGLATDLGREMNVPMPLANLAEQNMIEGMNRGWDRRDSSAAFQLQEERADVTVRHSS